MTEYRASQTVSAQEAAFLKEVVNRLGELEKLALEGKLREYHLDGLDDPNGINTNIDLLSIKDAIEASGTSSNLSTALHSKLGIIKGLEAIFKPEMACLETFNRIRLCQQGIPKGNGGPRRYQKTVFGDDKAPQGSSRRLSLRLIIGDLGGPKEFDITEIELDKFERKALKRESRMLRRASGKMPASILLAEDKSATTTQNSKQYDGAPSGGNFTIN